MVGGARHSPSRFPAPRTPPHTIHTYSIHTAPVPCHAMPSRPYIRPSPYQPAHTHTYMHTKLYHTRPSYPADRARDTQGLLSHVAVPQVDVSRYLEIRRLPPNTQPCVLLFLFIITTLTWARTSSLLLACLFACQTVHVLLYTSRSKNCQNIGATLN